jgi:hypothetical protein
MPTSDLTTACSAGRARTTGARTLLVLLGLYVLGSSLPARAEEIGARHNLVISAERLFGIYIDNQSVDRGAAPSIDRHHTVFALGWGGSPSSTLTVPRAGIDYFLTEALTLGGNFGFFSHNIDAGGNQSTTLTGLLFAARVGYALRLGHAISFWPRAGFTYTTSSGNSHILALTVDAPFTFSPSEGFAILAGPVLELGLIGKENRADYSEVLFGLMVGLAGWTGL